MVIITEYVEPDNLSTVNSSESSRENSNSLQQIPTNSRIDEAFDFREELREPAEIRGSKMNGALECARTFNNWSVDVNSTRGKLQYTNSCSTSSRIEEENTSSMHRYTKKRKLC